MDVSVPFKKISVLAGMIALASSCTTLPKVVHEKHKFPRGAYVGDPGRPFKKLGLVKTKTLYPTLDPDSDERVLCKVYYNKAVKDLLKRAHDVKADAVVNIHSAVFMIDGRSEFFATPECTDDGQEGQVLVEGIAVRWKSEKEMSAEEKVQYAEWKKSPKWSQAPENGMVLETTAVSSSPIKRSVEPSATPSPAVSEVPVVSVVNTSEGKFSGYTEEVEPLKVAPAVATPSIAAATPLVEAPPVSPASLATPAAEEDAAPARKAKRRQTLIRPNGPLLR